MYQRDHDDVVWDVCVGCVCGMRVWDGGVWVWVWVSVRGECAWWVWVLWVLVWLCECECVSV